MQEILKKTPACKVAASDLFTAQCRTDCNIRWAVSIDVTDELEGSNGIGVACWEWTDRHSACNGVPRVNGVSISHDFCVQKNGKKPVVVSGQIPAISMHLWFHGAGNVLSSTRWWRSVSNDKLTRTWQNVFTLFDDEYSKSFRCDCRRTWCHG